MVFMINKNVCKNSLIVITLLLFFTTSAKAELTDGLVIYYNFDSDATDSIGTYDGVVTGATLTPALINNGYDFGTESNNYYISSSPDYDSDSGSISVWLKMDDDGIQNFIFGDRYTNTVSSNYIYLNEDGTGNLNSRIRANTVVYTNLIANISINYNEWVHTVLLWDGSYEWLYINNTLVGNVSSGNWDNAGGSFLIGRTGQYDDYYYAGVMDEWGYWNRTLNAIEIEELYNDGTGIAYPFSNLTIELKTTYYDNTTSQINSFLQGDDILAYSTDSFGVCNLSINDNTSIEKEVINDTYISLCDTVCDNEFYSYSNNIKHTDQDFNYYSIHADICEKSTGSYLNITLSCSNETQTIQISQNVIPDCDIQYTRFFRNFSVCKGQNASINLTTNAKNSADEIRVKNLNTDEIYYNLTEVNMTYGNFSEFLNTTHYYDGKLEFYDDKTYTLSMSCYNSTISITDTHNIEVGDVAPVTNLNLINVAGFTYSYINNSVYEYYSDNYTFIFSIEDIDLDLSLNYSLFCNDTLIDSGNDITVLNNEYDLYINGTLFRDFSDITNLSLNCSIYVNSTDGTELSENRFDFIINDTISPVCTGLIDDITQYTTYNWSVHCYDESFYSLNITCANGFSFYEDGILQETYSYTNSSTGFNDSVTPCTYKYCDGHTKEKLQRIKPSIYQNELFISSFKGQNKLKFETSDNLEYIETYDRIKFKISKKNASKGTKMFKFTYYTIAGQYYPSEKYKGWIIDPVTQTWFDINSKDYDNYNIKDNKDGSFDVTILSQKDTVEFESIGELNCVTGSFEITYIPPSIYKFKTGECPVDDTPTAILFSSILFLCMGILMIGIWYDLGVFTFLSGLMFVFLSFSLMGCSVAIGSIMAIIGIILVTIGGLKQKAL